MGFRMSCDRCGRFMRNVKLADIKSMPDEIICKECINVENRVKRDIDVIKRKAENDFNTLATAYKEEIVKVIEKRVDGDTSD